MSLVPDAGPTTPLSNGAVTAVPQAGPDPTSLRQVSGRYRGTWRDSQIELRVDVDGARPTNRVSGDAFTVKASSTEYSGSFVVDAPTITTTPTEVRIEGLGRASDNTWTDTRVLVTVPRGPAAGAQPPATVVLSDSSPDSVTILCSFVSPHLRTVAFEQDSVAGAVPFVSYDTTSLPQPPGSTDRVLSVATAYAEAGIEFVTSGTPNVVPVKDAGAEDTPTWSDAELHNAMTNHFSLYSASARWQLWMLVATRYDDPKVRGIMFDYSDANQRQGSAVFYDAIKGDAATDTRAQLRTYVHELGHAFNLLHSWDKGRANPPQPLGPNGGLGDLSWMNYAWKYQPAPDQPGGDTAYWAAFPFQFTQNELVHLRHGFRDDVIMGAYSFGKGAAEVAPDLFDAPMTDRTGLALELRLPRPALRYGEPVVVELKLATTDTRGHTTHGYLHPNDGMVTIGIQQPSGRTVAYRPLMRRCVDADARVSLTADRALYDSAYIGFGSDGFLFDTPGTYRLRATYAATDGSKVVSQTVRLRVRPPSTPEDEAAGELLLGQEQGQMLALLGSDAGSLRVGGDALAQLVDEHATHPLAVYARLATGVNAQRDFKDLTPEKRLRVRKARPDESAQALQEVERASTGAEGLDNVTLNMAMRTQARAVAKSGDLAQAKEVLARMVPTFKAKGVKQAVLSTIRKQAETASADLAAEFGR